MTHKTSTLAQLLLHETKVAQNRGAFYSIQLCLVEYLSYPYIWKPSVAFNFCNKSCAKVVCVCQALHTDVRVMRERERGRRVNDVFI